MKTRSETPPLRTPRIPVAKIEPTTLPPSDPPYTLATLWRELNVFFDRDLYSRWFPAYTTSKIMAALHPETTPLDLSPYYRKWSASASLHPRFILLPLPTRQTVPYSNPWHAPMRKLMLDNEIPIFLYEKCTQPFKTEGEYTSFLPVDIPEISHEHASVSYEACVRGSSVRERLGLCYFDRMKTEKFLNIPGLHANIESAICALERCSEEAQRLFFKFMSKLGDSKQPLDKLIQNYFTFLEILQTIEMPSHHAPTVAASVIAPTSGSTYLTVERLLTIRWKVPYLGCDPAVLMDALLYILLRAEENHCVELQLEKLNGFELLAINMMPLLTGALKIVAPELCIAPEKSPQTVENCLRLNTLFTKRLPIEIARADREFEAYTKSWCGILQPADFYFFIYQYDLLVHLMRLPHILSALRGGSDFFVVLLIDLYSIRAETDSVVALSNVLYTLEEILLLQRQEQQALWTREPAQTMSIGISEEADAAVARGSEHSLSSLVSSVPPIVPAPPFHAVAGAATAGLPTAEASAASAAELSVVFGSP